MHFDPPHGCVIKLGRTPVRFTLYPPTADSCLFYSESVSIPKNPRTERPVGYAFVDLSTPTEAERAVTELSGKEILERKVSVQLARKPEAPGEKEGTNGEAAEGTRRQSTRGRGRANRSRGGRGRVGAAVRTLLNNCPFCQSSTNKLQGGECTHRKRRCCRRCGSCRGNSGCQQQPRNYRGDWWQEGSPAP